MHFCRHHHIHPFHHHQDPSHHHHHHHCNCSAVGDSLEDRDVGWTETALQLYLHFVHLKWVYTLTYTCTRSGPPLPASSKLHVTCCPVYASSGGMNHVEEAAYQLHHVYFQLCSVYSVLLYQHVPTCTLCIMYQQAERYYATCTKNAQARIETGCRGNVPPSVVYHQACPVYQM